MQLTDIALKNLQRRKSKMLFLVLGIVFGIATIVTLFTLTNAMENSITKRIQDTGQKMVVVPKNDAISFSVGGIPVVSGVSYKSKNLPANAPEVIRSVPGGDKIRVIAPKVMGTFQSNGKKALLVGVDFPGEFKIKPWWDIDGSRPTQKGQAIVGWKAAERMKTAVGQKIEVSGRALTVSGILKETGEDEDGIVFVDINTAQEILGMQGSYSFVEINTVKDDVLAGDLSREIAQKLPDSRVKIVKQEAESRQELVDRFSRFSVIVALVMIVVAALIITTTMMASVNERTREIGIFRAIGFRKAHITKIILVEAGVVSAISGVAGYFAGMGGAALIAPLFSDFKLVVMWNPFLGLAVFAGTVVLGILASIYPASKAAKLDPAESLRFI